MYAPYHSILESQDFFFRSMSASIFEHEGIVANAMGINSPYFNLVLQTNLNEKKFHEIMPEIKRFFAENNLAWSWLVFPFSQPDGLVYLLKGCGMKEIERLTVMGRNMTHPLPQLPELVHLVCEVECKEKLSDRGIPLQEGFDTSEEELLQFKTLTERIPFGNENMFHHYVLYDDNIPVASATLSCHQDNARLDNIAVCPAYQGKGYGTAITYYLIAEAKRLNVNYCFLDASHQGTALYKKLGFQAYYTGSMYSYAY